MLSVFQGALSITSSLTSVVGGMGGIIMWSEDTRLHREEGCLQGKEAGLGRCAQAGLHFLVWASSFNGHIPGGGPVCLLQQPSLSVRGLLPQIAMGQATK